MQCLNALTFLLLPSLLVLHVFAHALWITYAK